MIVWIIWDYVEQSWRKNNEVALESALVNKYSIRVNQSCLFVTNSFVEDDLHSSDIKHD